MVRIVSEQIQGDGCGRLVAMDGERNVGAASYRKGAECRIDSLQVSEDAPEDTVERLVRSVMAIAANEGIGAVSVHSSDEDGSIHRACSRMGFYAMDGCPCCQRSGSVCLRMRFRGLISSQKPSLPLARKPSAAPAGRPSPSSPSSALDRTSTGCTCCSPPPAGSLRSPGP